MCLLISRILRLSPWQHPSIHPCLVFHTIPIFRPVARRGSRGFGRTPLFRPVTIAHANIKAWRSHTYTPLAYREGVRLRTYIQCATNHTRCVRARCEEDRRVRSDRLASCQHATSVLSSAKGKPLNRTVRS